MRAKLAHELYWRFAPPQLNNQANIYIYTMMDDIFSQIDRIVEHGPTDDEVHRAIIAVAATPSQHDSASSGEAAASIASHGDAENSNIPISSECLNARSVYQESASPQSFLSDVEMDHYEGDINEINVVSPLFQPIMPTTFGLSGTLSGVAFQENTLIQYIPGKLKFPCIRAVCNFGDIRTPEFEQLVSDGRIDMASTEKSARARSKKQKRAGSKPRKIQGNGTCFNSSILFWIYSELHRSVYKIRLFRTGQFGLPGTKPEMIRDIINVCHNTLIPTLRDIIHARNIGDQSEATVSGQLQSPPDITLQSLTSIMKNYKWRRIVEDGCILDLQTISTQIEDDMKVMGRIPFLIGYVHYGYSDSKLSIKFKTPSLSRADKTIRVNIFLSGKINILGAHDSATTKNICQYLISILSEPRVVIRTDPIAAHLTFNPDGSPAYANLSDLDLSDLDLSDLDDDFDASCV